MENSRHRDLGKISATWNSVFEHNSTAALKQVLRIYLLISFISQLNFLSCQQQDVITTFWEVPQHSMAVPLKQKGQELTATSTSQELSANSLLFLWEAEGRESFIMALNCFPLFNPPLGKALHYPWIVDMLYNLGQKFSFGWQTESLP